MDLRDEFLQDMPMSTEIQKLGSRLWRQVQNDGLKVILITSALRGEGKSTTVAYLASALALNPGRRILALDTDFRNPSLNAYFGVKVEKGLADVLRGECSVTEAIVHSGLQGTDSGLDLMMPIGDSADPQILLNTPRLVEVLRILRRSYDLILVDAPALIPVADAAALVPLCDAVILTVMAGASTKHHLKRARELCIGLGANILGLVVGNVQQAAPEYMDMNYYSYRGMHRKQGQSGQGRSQTREDS